MPIFNFEIRIWTWECRFSILSYVTRLHCIISLQISSQAQTHTQTVTMPYVFGFYRAYISSKLSGHCIRTNLHAWKLIVCHAQACCAMREARSDFAGYHCNLFVIKSDEWPKIENAIGVRWCLSWVEFFEELHWNNSSVTTEVPRKTPPYFTARLLLCEGKIRMLKQTVGAGQSDNRRERCIWACLKFEIKSRRKDAVLRSGAQTED